MKNTHYILATLAAMILIASCAKEDSYVADVTPTNVATLTIDIPGVGPQSRATVVATDAEKVVNSISVFIVSDGVIERTINIDPKSSIIDANNSWDAVFKTLTMKEITPLDKERTIYVATNWTAPASVIDEATLKEAMTTVSTLMVVRVPTHYDPNPPPVDPLVMSGSTVHNFATSLAAKVQLKRQVAKINFRLAFSAQFDAWIRKNKHNIDDYFSIEVINAPATSYLIERGAMPSAGTMLPDAICSGYSPMSSTTLQFPTIYLYENTTTGSTPADAAKATYFIINIPYYIQDVTNGSKVESNLYKIQINTKSGDNPYAILRNNAYMIEGKIDGFGQSAISRSSIDDIPLIETTTTQIAL